MGDPARVILCNAIISEIVDDDLVPKTAAVGNELYSALETLAGKYPQNMVDLRGKGCGTYIAFDTLAAPGLVVEMRSRGVNIGTCGQNTVRFRPMLIFKSEMITPVVKALEESFPAMQ